MRERTPRLIERLSRRTSDGRYLPEIDGVRFLAISIVLAVHVFAAAGLSSGNVQMVRPFGPIVPGPRSAAGVDSLLQYGHIGVYLFFILSGFVLAVPFIRSRVKGSPPVRMSSYFMRRLTRIEPPFLAMTLLLFVMSLAVHQSPSRGHLVTTLLYSHQAAYGHLSPIDGVFWSLEAEVQWYLIVPILAVALCRGTSRQRLLAVATATVTAIVVQFVLGPSILSRIILLDNLQFFLIGWFVAEIHVTRLNERPRASAHLDLLGFACIPLFFVAINLHPPSWRLTLPVLGAVVITAALHGRAFRRLFSLRWIAIIGGMCYSIYLVHYPLLVLGGQLFRFDNVSHNYAAWLWFGALLILALVLSATFFAFVERPCMDPTWVRRLATRGKRFRPRRSRQSPADTRSGMARPDPTTARSA